MATPLQETRIRSASKEVVIGGMHRFCLIGERINPTGRRIFQEQLREGDLSAIERDVKAQVEGGADVLDVNMGVPLTDEAELLAKAITMIQELTDLPLCIDSSVVEALDAGLAAYEGRALVNSITAEDERMEQILPLVKKYDAAVIALPNDVDEIPMEPEKRLMLVDKIVDVATKEYGIALEDIVIDPLAMPIGADQQTAMSTMETMRGIRDKHGLNMTCGASNVSFGMPGRHELNGTFLSMAMTAGLTSAIMDTRTESVVSAVKATDLLLGTTTSGGWRGSPGTGQPRQPRRRDGEARATGRAGHVARGNRARGADGPTRGAGRDARRHRTGARCRSRSRTVRTRPSASRRASTSSMRRRGTASPSTRRVAATAPATSARSVSTSGRRSRATTAVPSATASCARVGGWRAWPPRRRTSRSRSRR